MYNFNFESGKTLNNWKSLESYKFKNENFSPNSYGQKLKYGHEEIGDAFFRKISRNWWRNQSVAGKFQTCIRHG